ncbi:type II/IV secretion system protein, partial [Ralstonia solanacearum]|nr:type II/IV secretion system protein [Ralstonia solanacearum]MBB6597959.1 type II/IV secretion system protein [Ralstonia solanacearum]MDB0544219.1 type II/IV secretion system protein [Ralstonia solanacearum]MDB0559142.1 type II/IV secretion system protein [Ralstonia solanacearum]
MSELAPDWTTFGSSLRAARLARGNGSLAVALAEQAGMPAQALVAAAAGRFGFHLLEAEGGDLAPLVTLDPISL